MILINFLKTHSVICYLKCFNSSYLEVVVKVAGHSARLLPLDSDPVHLAPGAVREAVVATVLNIIHIDNDSVGASHSWDHSTARIPRRREMDAMSGVILMASAMWHSTWTETIRDD